MLKKHAKMFNIGIDKHSTIPHRPSLSFRTWCGIEEVFLYSNMKRMNPF